MSEQDNKKEASRLLVKTATLLRVDPDVLVESWQNIRHNRHRLVQADTWKEILGEVPRRVKASAVLVVVLVLAVLWGQRLLTPAQKQAIRVILPQPLISQPRATATTTPRSLQSATDNDRPAPTPIVTPLFLFHTVQANESLISIAAHYNITTEALLAANNIRDPSQLHLGKHLLIPPAEGQLQQKIIVHDIKAGETLLSIATKYGSSVKALLEANPNLSDGPLSPNQTVAVPVVFEDENLTADPNTIAETEFHTVQSGEYPLAIAAQYDIPVEILLSANSITDATRLQVGQVLRIPPHEGVSLGFPVILYELTSGDTLVGIASRFGSSVKDILAVNPELAPAQLQPGQTVAIPVIFTPKKQFNPSTLVTPTPVPPPPLIPSLTQQMVDVVNAERISRNLPPYQVNLDLAAVALQHAQDMVVRDFVAHTNPDGEGPKDRLFDNGIDDAIRVGENIQINARSESTTVDSAVEWFMNSPPHRAGILNRFYTQIGVAAVKNPAGWFYYVIDFAQR